MKENKEKLIVGGMILVVIFFLFSACKKSTSPIPVDLDKAAITGLIASDDTSFSTTIFDTSTVGYPKMISGDTVKFWWRKIQRVTRGIDVVKYPADSASGHPQPWAIVTVTDMLYGRLMILGDSSDTYFVRSKPLTDQAVRTALFVKMGTDADDHRGWKLKGVSDLLIHSVPSTRVIEKMHILARRAGLVVVDDTLFESDITRIIPLDSIVNLQKGDTVTVTVTTADSSDSVCLHTIDCYYYNCKPHREDFENNHNGTFTITGVIGNEMEQGMHIMRRHIAIDVLKHTSLDTVDGPYDSRIWGLIYRVNVPQP